MDYKEWKKKIEEENEEWSDGMQFEIKCKKCKSKNVIIDKEDDISCSETTGMWGSAKAVIKCLGCGNAFGITIAEPQ